MQLIGDTNFSLIRIVLINDDVVAILLATNYHDITLIYTRSRETWWEGIDIVICVSPLCVNTRKYNDGVNSQVKRNRRGTYSIRIKF